MAKRIVSKLLSKLPIKSGALPQVPPAAARLSKPPALKYVFFIVDWKHVKIVSDVLEEEKVRFFFTSKGMGTARSETLDLLGIGAEEKAIITCLEQAVLVPVLMKEVRKKLNQTGPGAGITFSIPLSAINDPILLIFKQSILKNEKIPAAAAAALNSAAASSPENKGENMANEYSHDLIAAIVNHGYSDELMNTAREAGAAGGTVIHARGTAHQGAVKFFGVSVQDEKEIILILADREKKLAIMKTISEVHGLNSKAHGLVFSLPVDNVAGLILD